jgi:hypothetical protein
LATADLLEGMNQVGSGLIFQDVSSNPGAQSFNDILVFIVARQQDSLRLRTRSLQFPGCNQPVHQRHADIQDSDLGLQLLCDANQFLSIARFPDDLEAFALEKRLDSVAH